MRSHVKKISHYDGPFLRAVCDANIFTMFKFIVVMAPMEFDCDQMRKISLPHLVRSSLDEAG